MGSSLKLLQLALAKGAKPALATSSLVLLGSVTWYHWWHPKPPRSNEQCKTNLIELQKKKHKNNLPKSYLAHVSCCCFRDSWLQSRLSPEAFIWATTSSLWPCQSRKKLNGSFDLIPSNHEILIISPPALRTSHWNILVVIVVVTSLSHLLSHTSYTS